MKKLVTLMGVIMAVAGISQATLSIGSLDTATVISWGTNAVSDTWYGKPTGSGFASTPASASPYDSDTWAAYVGGSTNVIRAADGTGTSGNVGFGGTVAAGNVSRGMNVTATGTAGLCIASNTASSYMMGFKPSGTGTDNATVWMRIVNNTGASVSSWTFDFDAFYIDTSSYNTAFTFSFSTDDSTYTDVAALSGSSAGAGTVVTPTVADWTAISLDATTVNATVANGGYLYLRLKLGGDIPVNLTVGDSIGIDNISITANTPIPEPATVGMLGLGALVTLMVRRIRR